MMQKDNITYIKMRECDVKGVSEVESECFSEPWSENVFRSELDNENAVTIAALDGEKVVGFINFHCILDEVNINNVAVTESFRKNHIGENLVILSEEYVKDKASVINLEVRESNLPAIALYKKLGFDEVGMRKNFYTKPTENAILMTKRLKK